MTLTIRVIFLRKIISQENDFHENLELPRIIKALLFGFYVGKA